MHYASKIYRVQFALGSLRLEPVSIPNKVV